jgi:hypothetical protein
VPRFNGENQESKKGLTLRSQALEEITTEGIFQQDMDLHSLSKPLQVL